MLQTVEAWLDPQGRLKFLENIHWHSNQRVLVTFLQPQPAQPDVSQNYEQLMQRLAYVRPGKSFSRDERNER